MGRQQVDLFQAMDDRMQSMFDDLPRIAFAEDAFEQQDGLANAAFAQGDGVFTFEQANPSASPCKASTARHCP
jgi:hypothetical protein